MRVFPQKPQYILVSNNAAQQKRTNLFSQTEKIGITVVVVLFLAYLVIFMQAVFNYFQHQQAQITTQARMHINPNSVQQDYSLDNISQGYPSFVAIPKAAVDHSLGLYKDFVEHNDSSISADNVVQKLDKAIRYQRSQVLLNTQLAKLGHKQDYPKAVRQISDEADKAKIAIKPPSVTKSQTTTIKALTKPPRKPPSVTKSQTTTIKSQAENKANANARKAKSRNITPTPSQPQASAHRKKSTTSTSAKKARPKPIVKAKTKTVQKIKKPVKHRPKKSKKETKIAIPAKPVKKEKTRVSSQATMVKTKKAPLSMQPSKPSSTKGNAGKQTAKTSQDSFNILEQSLGL
ncbi:MAG TPA: hypothetical protein ENK78_03275 [Thiothrix sp.]|nr:hypothetical protein [Thiothrix sp.]